MNIAAEWFDLMNLCFRVKSRTIQITKFWLLLSCVLQYFSFFEKGGGLCYNCMYIQGVLMRYLISLVTCFICFIDLNCGLLSRFQVFETVVWPVISHVIYLQLHFDFISICHHCVLAVNICIVY